MELKDKDKIIADILCKMYEDSQTGKCFDISKYLIKKYMINLDYLSETDRIIEIMEDNNLIIKSNDKSKELTRHAKGILENENWLDFVNARERERERKRKKDEHDYKISEYLVRTRFWPLIISSVAIFISAISLIVSVQQYRQGRLSTQPIKQYELPEHDHPMTQKTVDSLDILKSDSLNKN